MANIKSQIKRIKTNEKARLRNKSVKSELKTYVRRVREAVAQRPGVSALTLIVGPNVTDTEAAHLARLVPIDVPVSIIRIGAEGVRARRDLGRGVLLDCSTLDDLPRIIVAGGLA